MSYPTRVICLAAEAPEIMDRLGVFDRIIAVSGFARRPAGVRRLPKVGGFADPDLAKIAALQPDLVITLSDIQADAVAALVRQGIPVLALNPHRLVDVWRNILLIGGVLGKQAEAEALVAELQAEMDRLQRTLVPVNAPRPRVYFEEWYDPLISGIGWVSDLISWAGGDDIFGSLAAHHAARERIVTPEQVIAQQPGVIIASWCGKKADLAAIATRPGWDALPAVQQSALYELSSHLILQTGPSLLDGARQLATLIHQGQPVPLGAVA